MTSLYIGLAGMLGALTRYAVSLAWNPFIASAFPWGTLFCNYSGSLLLAFLAYAPVLRIQESLRLAITTGFIGAYTTFSALSYETFTMMNSGNIGQGLVYVTVSLWGGLLFAWLGIRVAGVLAARRETR